MGPSISESSGIPKRKKSSETGDIDFAPLFTGATIYCAPTLAWQRLT
jgi:hypothetical protein